MKPFFNHFLCSATLSFALLAPDSGQSAIPALNVNPGDTVPVGGGPAVTVGWRFSVHTPIQVTGLGVYDDASDGLMESHSVVIWDEITGGTVMSGMAEAGDGGDLLHGFRYGHIEAQILEPGHYVIGAFYEEGSQDLQLTRVQAVTSDPALTFLEGRYFPFEELQLPRLPAIGIGIFGPNFLMISESPPAILTQPSPQLVYVGSNAVFQVVATGAPPLQYQWRYEGQPLSEGKEATLILTNVQLEDAGQYDVIVSNEFGDPVTSDPVALEVSFLQVAQYTGLTVLGQPGDEFRIDYTIDVAEPDWIAATNLTLKGISETWIDLESRFTKHRFYRAVLLTTP